MNRQQVRDAVCNAIARTLQRSGRDVPEFKDTDKPLRQYDGFDSQCGVEVTLELEQLLGIDDLGTDIFVKGTGYVLRARTLSEVVSAVLKVLKKGYNS